MRRVAASIALLGLALASTTASAQDRAPRPLDPGQVYLSQALTSLARAHQLALQARQFQPEGFDVELFLHELGAVADGLQRYLLPNAPVPGRMVDVEITGQYLYEGLAAPRRADRGPSPPREKE